jgi:hypothetical protein
VDIIYSDYDDNYGNDCDYGERGGGGGEALFGDWLGLQLQV